MRTLTRMERRWAHAAFGAIFPSGASEKIPLGICDFDLDAYLIETQNRVPFRTALGLRVAIWMIALAPLFVLNRMCTIVALDPASREDLLQRMLASPVYVVRQLVMLLKAVGAVLYAGAPVMREAILAASAPPELNRSGTRLIGIGRKGETAAPGEADEAGEVDEAEEKEEHDEQSVA